MIIGRTFLLATAALACAYSAPAGAQEKLKVVATFSILGDMLRRVGGDRVEVKTLVGPEGDAHVYQPTPADAADIGRARVVFQNGLKLEGWIDRLIKSSGFRGALVEASKGVKTIKAGKADSHGHGHAAVDPHAFQNAANAVIYVRNIKDALCKVDASGCAIYGRNADDYAAEIGKLDAAIKAQMATIPAERRKVITSHDAFGYFAHAYGITFLAPRGVSTDSEASAKDVALLITQIRKEKATALFVENITDGRLIEQIARETKVRIGGKLYSDALSKADGPAATYLDLMRHNARLIAEALGSES